MSRKKAFVFSALAILTLTAYLLGSHAPPSKHPVVYELPSTYHEAVSIEPYQGPHPAQIKRPPDTFAFPIKRGETGPVEPLFAGPLQYPFLCSTEQSGFGQPLVDNQEGAGIPVYRLDAQGRKTDEIVGYSKDCLIPTQAGYYYNRVGTDRFYPLHEANGDIARITVQGEEIDFILRIEVGVINRFIYAIAALKGPNGTLDKPDGSRWNGRLIYQFNGGVGIGRRQGRLRLDRILDRNIERLQRGYALIHSTGNRTSNHYNIWLQEDTALRVKRQFIALYGEPLYTVGVGGSGGAIQQYLLGQNNPDILDAAIPLYSYPDMVTQTIYVLDCELTEYLFDISDADNEKWRRWENRQLVQGMNAVSGERGEFHYLTALSRLLKGRWPFIEPGQSECVKSWRGLTPMVKNPNFVHFADQLSDNVVRKVKWTYWDDLKYFYGVDAAGYARHTWDNVGVQYGLQALQEGRITPEEFLAVNAKIGSWKHPKDMRQERFSYFYYVAGTNPTKFSIWGDHNIRKSPDGGVTPAPRFEGDVAAMRAAYWSGNVFLGRIGIPIIDLRHYLEPELDMHHALASFSTRQRMIEAQGQADNQVIWMTRKPHTPVDLAFQVMDRWMLNMLANPAAGVAANKPAQAVDTCFNAQGEVIAAGTGVWDGRWNGKAQGACSAVYPSYPNSRIIAGDSVAGWVFKCQLQSVDAALAKGVYGPVDMTPYRARLHAIFPQGVCDYSKPDLGRPEGL